jgi:hypothetical protein
VWVRVEGNWGWARAGDQHTYLPRYLPGSPRGIEGLRPVLSCPVYKGYVEKVFPPLHVDACAVSQLPRCISVSTTSSSSGLTRPLPALADTNCID